ncbi:DUF748 domain-containing protein [Thalassotalea sp. ND16A]|uniref:DUF748 domain-containing protein n=1 Tax=Thalassotalea sp. ND16A TaxID=1535422 RepID=UPI00051CC9F7|nr:DUF748 domain-containing protein [Thalassotalea sp. ND16A]KGK00752.1 hypothetical protein ND16A_0236 [Thalassotalea sp. ND16A]
MSTLNPLMSQHKFKLIFVSGILLFLVLFPIAFKFWLIAKITDQGFETAQIEDVDINIFTGQVALKNVYLFHQGTEKLALGELKVDYRWQGIFSGGLTTELVEISDANMTIREDDNGQIEAIIPIINTNNQQANSVDSKPTTLNLPNLDVDLVRFNNITAIIDVANFQSVFKINSFRLTRASTWHDNPVELALHGQLGEAQIDVDLSAQPLIKQPSVKGRISVQGFQLKSLHNLLPRPIKDLSGRIDSNISISGIRHDSDSLSFDISGQLNTSKLQAELPGTISTVASISQQIDLTLNIVGEEFSFLSKHDIAVDDLQVIDPEQKYTLARNEKLAVEQLSIDDSMHLQIGNSVFTNLQLISDHKSAAVAVKELQVKAIDYRLADNDIAIGDITATRLQAIIEQLEDGSYAAVEKLNNTFKLKPANEQEPLEQQSKENDPAAIAFSIAAIKLQSDSAITLLKREPQHHLNTQIKLDSFFLENIDAQSPDTYSPFQLKARIGEYSTIDIQGKSKFFAQPVSVIAAGEVDAISLPEISPYIESIVGYQFTKGQVDHKFSLSLENDQIDMSNDLLIRKMEIKDLANNDSISTIPLPFAIQMLEDSNGSIDLQVPVKGDLSNSEVGLRSLIQKALTKALQKGSLGFLKLALQPYGAIVMATEYVVDEANNINFEPILMTTNSTLLLPENSDYVDKITNLMENKEDLSISLCGVANESDKTEIMLSQQLAEGSTELKSALLELAKQRANSIKSLLVEVKVNHKRLFSCKPSYQQQGVSGVNISM